MVRPLSEFLGERKNCDFLLEAIYGLKKLDRNVFRVLTKHGDGMKIDALAEEVDRDRSTVYRSVQRLSDTELVEKKKVTYDSGGYYHVYDPEDPDEAAEEMKEQVSEWREQVDELIEEFRETY